MEIGHRLLSTGSGILSGYGPLQDPINLFLVQSVIIIGMCRAISLLGMYVKQPSVIFEVIGGILLGPSAIGKNSHFIKELFYPASLNYLSLVSHLGLLLYLFVVGLELDIDRLASHFRKAGSIAISGMAIPFVLGIAISSTMFEVLEKSDPKYSDVPATSFFVFIGTAMSITAFPVLARILKESGLIYTRVGAMTLGAAAFDDAVAWCLLILSISIANAKNMNVAGYVFGCVLAIAIGMYVLVRPLLEIGVKYLESFHSEIIRSNLFAFTIIIVFLCSWTTALLGLDVIFGSFIFGLMIPRKSQLFKDCVTHVEHFVLTITLPIYFALSGLKTDITQIKTAGQGAMIVLVCAIATFGKFLGAGKFYIFVG